MEGKLLLRVDEAAKACSLGRSKMYQLIAAGEIPSVKIGRSVRIPLLALREWVTHRTNSATEAESLSARRLW